MTLAQLHYRRRYYWRRFCVWVGFCPECHNRLNTKPSGRKWCPECGIGNL